MNPLELIIEVYETGESRLIRIFMFLYLLTMNVVIGSYMGELISMNYIGTPVTIESILLLISTKEIVLMIFLFILSVFITIYFVRFVTFLMAILFLIIYLLLSKLGINRFVVFFVLKLFNVITIDNKRGKHFPELIDMNSKLGNETTKTLVFNYIDFLCSVFIVTLFAFEIWIEGKYFPNWIDCVIAIFLWSINIYWILNVACIKSISVLIDKIESLILEIRQ